MALVTMTQTVRDPVGRPRKGTRAVIRLFADVDHSGAMAHSIDGNLSVFGRNVQTVTTDDSGVLTVQVESTDAIDYPILPTYMVQYQPSGEAPSKPIYFTAPPGGGRIEDFIVEPPDRDDLDGGTPATSIYPWTIDGGTP